MNADDPAAETLRQLQTAFDQLSNYSLRLEIDDRAPSQVRGSLEDPKALRHRRARMTPAIIYMRRATMLAAQRAVEVRWWREQRVGHGQALKEMRPIAEQLGKQVAKLLAFLGGVRPRDVPSPQRPVPDDSASLSLEDALSAALDVADFEENSARALEAFRQRCAVTLTTAGARRPLNGPPDQDALREDIQALMRVRSLCAAVADIEKAAGGPGRPREDDKRLFVRVLAEAWTYCTESWPGHGATSKQAFQDFGAAAWSITFGGDGELERIVAGLEAPTDADLHEMKIRDLFQDADKIDRNFLDFVRRRGI